MREKIKLKINSPASREKLIHRIKRIRGQLEGIEKMLESKRDCLDIVQQISAVRAALANLSSLVLVEECQNLSNGKKKEKLELTLKELIKNI